VTHSPASEQVYLYATEWQAAEDTSSMTVHLAQDSLIQTVRQVQAAFEALLDILELQSQLESDTQAAAAENQSFLHSIASTLLAIGELRQKLRTMQIISCYCMCSHSHFRLLTHITQHTVAFVQQCNARRRPFAFCCCCVVQFLDMQVVVCLNCISGICCV